MRWFGYAVGVFMSVGGDSGRMLHLGLVWSRAELQKALRVLGVKG